MIAAKITTNACQNHRHANMAICNMEEPHRHMALEWPVVDYCSLKLVLLNPNLALSFHNESAQT